MTGLRLHPRLSRVVGAVWLAAALAMGLAAVIVLVDQRRLGWEWLAATGAAVVGWWCWHRSIEVDAHGIEQCVGWRRTRLLWSVVDRVEVPAAGLAPVRVALAGRGEVALQSAWGLSARQRTRLADAVATCAGSVGVEVTGVAAGGDPRSGATRGVEPPA